MPADTQHRGGSQPAGAELLARIVKLETQLGIQGANPQAFFAVRDKNGIQRVRVGYLPNGDYGVWLADSIGNQEELLPVSSNYYDGEISPGTAGVITTSYTLFANAPTVTAVIGASGDAIITASSFVTNTNGGFGDAALVVDGGAPALMIASGSASAAIACATTSVRRLVTWTSGPGLLTPGSHTFTLYYKTDNASHNIGFTGNYLSVEPL